MKFLNSIDSFSNWTGNVIKWLLYVLTIIVLFEVLMRYLFNSPTNWAFDTTMIINCAIFMGGAAYITYKNAHIRVDVLYNMFPRRLKVIIDLIYYILFFFPVSLSMIWYGSRNAYRSFLSGTISNTSSWGEPVWIWKAIIPVSFFLLLLQGIVELIRTIMLWKGENHVA
jgi:TRAP-type mannitol/chloroaromatic compound transport system permease small subunit